MVPVSFASFLFAGEPWALSEAGALWWPRQRALVVADLHLEKASWFAARGQMLPPYDSRVTLERLLADLSACGAEHIYALGDSFHDRAGPERLEPGAHALLAQVAGRADILWIDGNHDSGAHGACQPEALVGGIRLRHEALRDEPAPELSGHFHPKLRVVAGRRIGRPCLLRTPRRMILPAYGALTGGLDAGHAAIRAALAPGEPIDALIAAQGRIARFALPDSAQPAAGRQRRA